MKSVLIVDDETLIRKGICSLIDSLRTEGFQIVCEAANGREALKKTEDLHPDIVITDVKMPLMDGVELTRAILEKSPSSRVIILSSFNDYDYVRQTLLSGAVDYILKPRLNRAELLRVLRKAEKSMENQPEIAFYRSVLRPADVSPSFSSTLPVDFSCMEDLAYRAQTTAVQKILRSSLEKAVADGKPPVLSALYATFCKGYELAFLPILLLNETPPSFEQEEEALRRENSYQSFILQFDGMMAAADRRIAESAYQKLGKVLSEVWRYILNHYDEDLNLSSISDRFYINKSYLCQLFNCKLGISFGKFLTTVRINRACRLLEQGKDNIFQVGALVGYQDGGYFSRQFHKIIGVSPSDFQRRSDSASGESNGKSTTDPNRRGVLCLL